MLVAWDIGEKGRLTAFVLQGFVGRKSFLQSPLLLKDGN